MARHVEPQDFTLMAMRQLWCTFTSSPSVWWHVSQFLLLQELSRFTGSAGKLHRFTKFAQKMPRIVGIAGNLHRMVEMVEKLPMTRGIIVRLPRIIGMIGKLLRNICLAVICAGRRLSAVLEESLHWWQ